MVKGFDCATKLNSKTAAGLRKEGFEYVARYLGNSWKSFDKAEAKAIQDAGLKLISIFQKSNNGIQFFSKEQGISHAKEAEGFAKAVGQPEGTAIYFAVDFDAQSSHMSKILEFVEGIKSELKDYKVGIYGSYNVMQAVRGKVDYYWQTYAWSRGQIANFIHMHQYENDVKVAGVAIDRNDIKKEPGHWSDVKVVAPEETKVGSEIVTKPSRPSKRKKNSDGTYTVVSGDTLSEIAADFNVSVKELANWNNIENANLISAGQKLKLSADKIETAVKPAASSTKKVTKTYKVKSGDALSKLASKWGTTVKRLQELNGIKDPNKIYVGQTLKYETSGSVNNTKEYHTVLSGDNVTKIAKKYSTSVAAIKKLNPSIKDINKIYPKQKIRIK